MPAWLARFLLVSLLCSTLKAQNPSSQAPARKSVLILMPSYTAGRALGAILDGIQGRITELGGERVVMTVDAVAPIVTDRPDLNELELEWYRKSYAHQHFDLIVAVGAPTFAFVNQLRKAFWPGVPLVVCGLDAGSYHKETRFGPATGVLGEYDWRGNVALGKQLFPNTRHIAFTGGVSSFDRILNAPLESIVRGQKPEIEFIDLRRFTFEEQVSRVANLPADTVLFVGSFLQDVAGHATPPGPSGFRELVSRSANCPILWIDVLGYSTGGLGGSLVDYETVGREGGNLAMSVLAGLTPSDAPLTHSNAFQTRLDWRELQRWKVPDSRLPQGAFIDNRPSSIWREHRDAVLIAVAAIVAQALVIILLLIERRRRRLAQEQLAERLRFETLLAEVISSFAAFAGVDSERAILLCLQRVKDFFQADWASIWEPAGKDGKLLRTHVWPGMQSGPRELSTSGQFEATIARLVRGEEISFSNATELASLEDCESFRREGVRSLLAIPLRVNGQIAAALSIASLEKETEWPREIVLRMRTVTDVLGTTLARSRAEKGTERKETEQALCESEERLRIAAQAGRMFAYSWDAATDVIERSGESAEILGVEQGAATTGAAVSAMVHPEDRERLQGAMAKLAVEKPHLHITYRIIRPEGSIIWVDRNSRAYFDEDGKIRRIVGMVMDVTERKLAEEVCTRYAAIVESSGDAIAGADTDGTVTSWNQGAERLFGYSAKEAIGRNISFLSTADRLEDIPNVLKKVRKGESLRNYETVRRRKDGTCVDISLTISPIVDAEGRIVGSSAIARDITEQKRAAEARSRHSAIVESSEDAIISENLEGVIESWNAGAERIFGYAEAEAIGRPITILFPSELRNEENKILETVRAGRRIKQYETVRVTKAGTKIHVSLSISPVKDATGNVVGVSKIARDITERRRAEKTLRESEVLRGSILSSMRSSVAVVDHDGLIVEVNKQWTDLTSENGIKGLNGVGIGVNYLEACERAKGQAAEAEEEAIEGIRAVLRGSKDVFEIEYPCHSPSEQRWFRMTVDRLNQPQGGAVISHVNITERKNTELEQARSTEEIRHMNLVASMGHMVASLVHELAQPLAAILSNAQAGMRYASAAAPNLAEVQGAFADITEDDKRAAAVLQNIRSVLQKKTISPHEINLNELVEAAAGFVRNDAQLRGMHLRLNLAPETVLSQGDEVPLQQVLLNLINNGMDAMEQLPPAERILTVSTGQEAEKSCAWILVEDEGPGISAEIRAELFTPFVTTKSDGLGMGLSICRTITESLGGSIHLQDGTTRGAAFRVELPLTHGTRELKSALDGNSA